MAQADVLAPVKMMVVALPAYATPLNVMMQVGGMFVHGNSVGAAYVLLSLGTGANLGLIAWSWKSYGFRPAMAFLTIFSCVVLAIGYGVSDPLYSAGDVEHPHTHAFDVYRVSFPQSASGLPEQVSRRIAEDADMFELVSLGAIGVLFVIGMGLRIFDPKFHLETALAHPANPEPKGNSVLNANVPGAGVGVVTIVGLIVISIVGCFVFFPPPDQTLDDMRVIRAEALSFAASKDVEKAVRNIEIYDDLTRRLQVGYYLRNWEISEYQQAKTKLLRGRLEQLKDILETKQFDRVREASQAVSNAHRRVRESMLDS